MQSKSQILVNMRSGEKVAFDIQDIRDFVKVANQLFEEAGQFTTFSEWVQINEKAVIRKDEIIGVYFFPEGYVQNS